MDTAPISREHMSLAGTRQSLAVGKSNDRSVMAIADSVDIQHKAIDRLELVRLRIAAGYYNSPAAMDMLATRISTLI